MTREIDEAIRSRDIVRLDHALSDLPRASWRRVARRISEALADSAAAIAHAKALRDSTYTASRAVGAYMVADALRNPTEEAVDVLHSLAGDADPSVRRAAVLVLSVALASSFPATLSYLGVWVDDTEKALRTAVALAARAAADPRRLERASPLIKLVSPLLADTDRGVQRASTDAVAALLGAYPDPTFEALLAWSTSHDSSVLRGVAGALASPAAAPLARKALIVLRKLSVDERPAVRRAVASSLWRLARLRPDIVRPEISRWLDDETRAPVAREAARHL